MDKKERWQGEAMRLGGEELVERIFEIADDLKDLRDVNNGILAMMRKSDDRHDSHEAGFAMLLKAIPGGDVEGHRRAHEAMIEDINSRKRLTEAIREKTYSGIIWAIIIGVAMAVWHEVQLRVGFRIGGLK